MPDNYRFLRDSEKKSQPGQPTETLNREQRQAILDALEKTGDTVSIFKKAYTDSLETSFRLPKEKLNPEQRKAMLEALEKNLPSLIKKAEKQGQEMSEALKEAIEEPQAKPGPSSSGL